MNQLLSGSFCLLCSAATAFAQAGPQQATPAPIERQVPGTATLRVESRLVNLALNVIDEHGAPVSGLTMADFEIAEDSKPQRIAIFEKESTTPLAVVLAIDTSGSVFNDVRLEREAARQFVQSILRPQDQVGLLQFSDDVDEVVPFTNDPRRIDAGLNRLQAGDATALYDAIYLGSQRLGQAKPTPGQRRVLVLITDGENTTHRGSYDGALEQAERSGTTIYALILVPVASDAGRNVGGEHALIQMARDTGGRFYYVEDKHDLAPALARVSDDLRTQYTLGYYAPQVGGDGRGLRHIVVQLKDPALRARYALRYRTAYYGNR